MKLSKAIELMEIDVKDPGEIAIDDYINSAKLLIEAGKFYKDLKEWSEGYKGHLLPGETP